MTADTFESVAEGRKDDLVHGQMVIITARWILVAAGLLLALWNPGALGELRVQIALILGLAIANFFLHAQILMKRPVLEPVVYAASAIDIAVISALVIAGGGLTSHLYVFYFPALLALSVTFRSEITAAYALGTLGAYVLIAGADLVGERGTVDAIEGSALVTRTLMLAAVAFCGNIYWRTEGNRRRAAMDSRRQLVDEFRHNALEQPTAALAEIEAEELAPDEPAPAAVARPLARPRRTGRRPRGYSRG